MAVAKRLRVPIKARVGFSRNDCDLPSRTSGRRAQQRDLVRRFLEAVAGRSAPQVEALTGIPAPTIKRLRVGQGRAYLENLGRMREYLASLNGDAVVGTVPGTERCLFWH